MPARRLSFHMRHMRLVWMRVRHLRQWYGGVLALLAHARYPTYCDCRSARLPCGSRMAYRSGSGRLFAVPPTASVVPRAAASAMRHPFMRRPAVRGRRSAKYLPSTTRKLESADAYAGHPVLFNAACCATVDRAERDVPLPLECLSRADGGFFGRRIGLAPRAAGLNQSISLLASASPRVRPK